MFTVSDRIILPADGHAEIAPLALLLDETADVIRFQAEAPTARICLYEVRFLVTESPLGEVKSQSSDIQEECSIQTDLMLTLIAGSDHRGWFGVYPGSGSKAVVTPSASYQWEPKAATRLAAGDGSTAFTQPEEAGPQFARYEAIVSESNLLTSLAGTLEFSGRGALKLRGMDLVLTTPESSAMYQTGVFDESGPVHDRVVRWLYVTFDSGSFVLESPSLAQVAAKTVDAQTRGEIQFVATEGQLASAHAIYEPRPGKLETLDGAFSASLAPTSEGATLRLEGQLASTSLQRTAIPTTPLGGFGWFGILVIGAVLGGATLVGGLTLYRARQRRDAENDIAYYTHYALLANDQFQLGEALEWLQAAQDIAPEDPELHIWAGGLLRKLGMHDEAMVAYTRAAQVSSASDGEPEYWMAVELLRQGRPETIDAARFHLERALQRQPDLFALILNDRLFAPLHGPDFDAMIAEAEQRMRQAV